MPSRPLLIIATILGCCIVFLTTLQTVAAPSNTTVGNGTAASCTGNALEAALSSGGAVTFNCGASPVTIAANTMVIDGDVAIDGGGRITLDGEDSRQIFIVNEDASLRLDNIVLTRGNWFGDGGAIVVYGALTMNNATIRDSRAEGGDAVGGAIHINGGRATLNDSQILDNYAFNGAGGINNSGGTLILDDVLLQGNTSENFAAIDSGGVLVMRNSRVLNNTATLGYGGGIGIVNGVATILDSTIGHNEATSLFGGGIAALGGETTVERSLIHDNRAASGGGGVYLHPNFDVAMTIRDSRIIHNATWQQEPPVDDINASGGGIYNGRVLTLDGVTVDNNRSGSGGGLFNYSSASSLTVLNSTFTNNMATYAAGAIWLSAEQEQTLESVTISGNHSLVYAGGLLVDGPATLRNLTLFANDGHYGANLYHRGTATIRNTILAAPAGAGDNCGFETPSAALISDGSNLDSDASCGLNESGDLNSVNPLLGALADNGGPTLTHLPQIGSPAIDVGDISVCPETDQRGYARPGGNRCDIGAVDTAAQPVVGELLSCGGTFPALADATIDQGAPGAMIGTHAQLAIARNGGNQKLTLLRFAIGDLPPEAAISSAEIELPLLSASDEAHIPIVVREVAEEWDEEAVNWQNQPATHFTYDEKSYTGTGSKLRVDVTPLAIRWANDNVAQLGVILAPGGTANMNVTARSREDGAELPKLIIRCTPRYGGNPPDRSAADFAQASARQKLAQNSTGTPQISLGLQSGILYASFQVPIPAGVAGESESRARWFLTEYKELLRLSDPATQLELVHRDESDGHLRFRQLVDGVPVEGGELVVHLASDPVGGYVVVGLNGFYMPDMVPLGVPGLDAHIADQLARALTGEGASTLGEPQLRYVTEQMVNPAGDPRSRLAWLVSASGGEGWYYTLIDANSGRLLATLPQQTTVFDLAVRRTFGATETTNCSMPLRTGTVWYTEDGRVQGAAPDPDADAAFVAMRDTYNYWNGARGIGRNSYDNRGSLINIYVGVRGAWQNAQWWCNQAEFAVGMVTRDIVAHEWGHGVMNFTVFPTYQREPGALNESLADIFGQAIDSDDWTLTEGSAIGTQRSMQNPAQFGDPDHYSGFLSFAAMTNCTAAANDNCGVHSNSGIHNKAAQLLIEGGQHNGISVTAMGRDKAVALYYNVLRLSLVNANSSFLDMRSALIAAIQVDRLPYINLGLGWTYSDNNICSIRNAYAAVGVGAGDANCDGVENSGTAEWWADADGDGIRNDLDRCPLLASGNNNDTDGDGVGDPCDPDDDNDTVCDDEGPLSGNVSGVPANGCTRGSGVAAGNVFDNCRLVSNLGQTDQDRDNIGDACDDDVDNDGRANAVDNCPTLPQGLKKGDWDDYDGDGVGDVCDWDSDNDGICNFGGPANFGANGVPVGGCKASPKIVNGSPADICPLAPDPGQEDTTESKQNKAPDNLGDACDLCPNLSDADNSDTDDDGVGDACDLDDDNDHVCDAGGPQAPGALGVIADPLNPTIGCVSGAPADNCPKIANRDQWDDDKNGKGFVCDPDEQDAFRKRVGDVGSKYTLVPGLGAQRFPIPICPQCGDMSLPPNFESVINVFVPSGYRAQVVDNFGSVRTSSPVNNATVRLTFVPALNAARQIGFGLQSAATDAATASLAQASQVAYYLEFIPDDSLPPDQEIETTVEISDGVPVSLFVPMAPK